MAARMYRWRAVAQGRGYFPIDMLRYDECWPAREGQLSVGHARPSDPPQTVELAAYSDSRARSPFTPERWASFGWRLTEARCAE